MTKESRSPSWWQTFPGVLTAVAALITALTGLIVAVHQAGWLQGFSSGAVVETTEPMRTDRSGPEAETNPRSTPVNRTMPDLIPSMSQVTTGEATYSLLDLKLEPRNPQSFNLSISVRMTNNGRFGKNFWDNSFRLLVDEVPRAPVSNLNKVVAGHSAEEGEVRFVVPQNAESLELQIHSNEETVLIPMEWKRH